LTRMIARNKNSWRNWPPPSKEIEKPWGGQGQFKDF